MSDIREVREVPAFAEEEPPLRLPPPPAQRTPSKPPPHHVIYMDPVPKQHRWTRVWLIPAVIAANCVVFLVTMIKNNCPGQDPEPKCVLKFLGPLSFQPLDENPLLGPSTDTLLSMGALDPSLAKDGQSWRLLSCMWLHAGVFHLLANMLGLIFIGIRLEKDFGPVRLGLLYLLSGVAGSLMSALFLKDNISVGASGALFGLLGATLSELITNWSIYYNKVGALFTLLLLIAINLAFGLMPHVDNFCHIGGLLAGFLAGFVLFVKPHFSWIENVYMLGHQAQQQGVETPKRGAYKPYQYVLQIAALAILVVLFTAAIISLYAGVDVNKECSWCHYMGCVDTPLWSCKSNGSVRCSITEYRNNTATLGCKDGTVNWVSDAGNRTSGELRKLCTNFCA